MVGYLAELSLLCSLTDWVWTEGYIRQLVVFAMLEKLLATYVVVWLSPDRKLFDNG